MNLILLGTSHKCADILARERFSFSRDDAFLFSSFLREKGISAGTIILSTCQRVEIYAQAEDAAQLRGHLLNFKGLGPDWGKYLCLKYNQEAVRHLFSVAAGLDSQIVGERQILHQIKEALLLARAHGFTSPLLNRLFERALFSGKVIRRDTGIGGTNPSVAQAAVEMAEALTGGLTHKKVYLIGAGIVCRQAASLCVGKGVDCILVANRTFTKAQELAFRLQAKAVRFNEFYPLLNEADILFSATSSRHFVLKRESFEKYRSGNKKIIIFDLAFPRDVDPLIAQLPEVTLFNLDDFKDVSLEKAQETARAMALIQEKAERFLEKEERRWNIKLACGQAA